MTLTNSYLCVKGLCSLLFLFACATLSGQVKQPFEVRYQETIKGDLTFIANNIVNRDDSSGSPEDPFNSNVINDGLNMQYIDVDNDPSTFSSSSANFSLTDPNCSIVRKAWLYWGGVYPFDGNDITGSRSGDYRQVKFRLPGGVYQNITADEVIFDGLNDPDLGDYAPYVCYTDVTDLVTAQADAQGEYTVADIRAASGSASNAFPGGVSAGWTLVIVYENPTLPAKNIATFDGFASIEENATVPVEIAINGFNTLPDPLPVNANIAIGALEGDNDLQGDQLAISANSNSTVFTNLTDALNPVDNFFNSSISQLGNAFTARTPNSENTLGWDMDLLEINNLLPNDETGAVLRATRGSGGDKYDLFFAALAVENIEPEIQITNTVEDLSGTNVDGTTVALGQELDYVITFDNTGNDDGSDFIITNVLPTNVDPLLDAFVLPDNGDPITVDYNETAHELTFTIPDSYVEVADPAYEIRIRVKVLEDCYGLRDACSNILQNTVYASYRGVLNDNLITTDLEATDFGSCSLPVPGATNYIDLDQCDFERDEYLCGTSITLTAGGGYTTYQWQQQDAAGNFINIAGANSQSYEVFIPGTYRVQKTAPSPCINDDETINVILVGDIGSIPFTDVADEVITCASDGSLVPHFYFCDPADERLLQADFPNANSITWQKLNEGCADQVSGACPTTAAGCGWTTVATGDQYTLNSDRAGEYRLVLEYDNGCTAIYPFKAFDFAIDPVLDISYGCIANSSSNEVVVSIDGLSVTDVIYNLDGGDDRFDNVFRNLTPGRHTITADYRGCIKTLDFEIEDITPVEISLANDTPNVIEMTASGGVAPYTFYVDGEYYGTSNTYRIRATGIYEVVVIDANGCESRAQIYLEYYDMEIPDFFTPNGDNLNDLWGPSNSDAYPSLKTIIYDRYGRVVGEMKAGELWDGRYNGSPLPTGDYWYVMKIDQVDQVKEFVGHFTLYR